MTFMFYKGFKLMAKIKLGIIGGGIDSAVGKAHVSAIRLSNEFDITACKFSKDLGLDKKSHNSYQIPWRSKPKDLQAFINEFIRNTMKINEII